jgi:predicted SprT family Zn-dependent metalloprotease
MPSVNPFPAEELIHQLRLAFNHFNEALFDSKLDGCFFTLERRGSAISYFWRARWQNQQQARAHEIALNPSLFAEHSLGELLQALARSQCMLWQHLYGKPSRAHYYNKEWAEKMESIGLVPSDTGLPGGRKVGQNVRHYLVEDGPLDRACISLIKKGFDVPWLDRNFSTGLWPVPTIEKSRKPRRASRSFLDSVIRTRFKDLTHYSESSPNARTKVKYSCVSCGANIWGKPQLTVRCGSCDRAFLPTEQNDCTVPSREKKSRQIAT